MTPRSAYRDFWAGVGERFPDLGGRRLDALLLGERAAAVHRALPRARGTADSQDRSVGRGEEHAHSRVGQPSGRARLRHRHLRADRDAGARRVRRAPRGHRCRAPSATCASCPSATTASTRSTRWARSSTSTKPSAPSQEMARVLKPGGRAIVGVPNRHDPFLRPLFATVLQAVGLYGYGYEKSYSRRALRQMLEQRRPGRRRRNGDPVHPRLAEDARPGVSLVVPAVRRGDGRARAAVRLPRSPRSGRAEARLPAGDRRHEAGTQGVNQRFASRSSTSATIFAAPPAREFAL